MQSDLNSKINRKKGRYNLRSASVANTSASKRSYEKAGPLMVLGGVESRDLWTPSKSPKNKRQNRVQIDIVTTRAPTVITNKYAVLDIDRTESDHNTNEIRSPYMLRSKTGTAKHKNTEYGKQRHTTKLQTIRKTVKYPRHGVVDLPPVDQIVSGAKAPNPSDFSQSHLYPLRGVCTEKSGWLRPHNLRLRPSQTHDGSGFDSSLSNNTETLAKARGCNFRLSSSSIGGSSHSEPPAVLGAPGLPAIADPKLT